MRLVIASCSVDYSGRLDAHLPRATRVLMLKADGSVLVHSDGGSYKPLNWMSAPARLNVPDPDEETAARDAVAHLLGLGHRRIAHITHDEETTVAVRLRRSAYETALRSVGIAPDPALVVAGGNDPAGADACARRLLDREDRPSAVFCYNDGMAAGVYRVAASLGLSIPQDLSVVGFDDLTLISTNLAPALTTMRLPHYEMADWLVRRLIAGDTPVPATTRRFPCEIVVRASTAAPGASA